ncbi:glycosyltransferase family 2 protein [Vibrio vulnificus]
MESISLAIVIPAYNEESSIGDVVREILDTVNLDFRIIVVSDKSSDNTAAVAADAGALVVDLEQNHGYAGAIDQGFQYALENLDPEYILTMDADGQHDPRVINSMYNLAVSHNIDIVTGRRPSCARISEKLYSFYFRNKFNIDDPLSGMKLYRTPVYVENNGFETFDSIGTELLTKALIARKKVEQINIPIRPRHDSEPRFGSLFRANKRIFVSLLNTVYRINVKF